MARTHHRRKHKRQLSPLFTLTIYLFATVEEPDDYLTALACRTVFGVIERWRKTETAKVELMGLERVLGIDVGGIHDAGAVNGAVNELTGATRLVYYIRCAPRCLAAELKFRACKKQTRNSNSILRLFLVRFWDVPSFAAKIKNTQQKQN
jgi:hypothetical protein